MLKISSIKRTKLCYSTQAPHLEYITSMGSVYQKLDHQEAEELRGDINRELLSSHACKPNLIKEGLKALAELREG